jgi:hypothetical protein
MKRRAVLAAVSLLLGCSQSPIQPDVDKEKIRAVVRSHDSEIKECYEKALKKNPSLSGKLVILWTISDSGKVLKAEIKSSDLMSPEVESCTIEKSKKWTFPSPPNDETAVLSYPYTFSPEVNSQ